MSSQAEFLAKLRLRWSQQQLSKDLEDPLHSRVKNISEISCVKKIRLPYSIVKTV